MHKLTISEIPSHTHRIPDQKTTNDALLTYNWTWMPLGQNRAEQGMRYWWSNPEYVGGSSSHNIVQPYIVTYMWKRVS